jgi:tRNA pseudouridine38-40 synthase
MRNLKLSIEYDGTDYHGWQTQGRTKTIQETIEKTLRKILQERVRLIASGRTDAGVHALAQVANFKTDKDISLERLLRGLNGLLPNDITINNIEEAEPDFHSRFDVKTKVYRYCILNRKYPSSLLRDKVYFYPYPLKIGLMRRQARCLFGRHDFKSFCAAGSSAKDTVRTIKNLTIKKSPCPLPLVPCPLNEGGLIIIEIEADGFLYNMVRNIVGTLLEIGRGRLLGGSLKSILLARDRRLAGPTVPACGLYLARIKY